MNASTDAFEALTAEVARLAEAVRRMAVREVSAEAIFGAGFAAGQDDIRKSAGMPVSGSAGRPRGASRGHLRAVQGGQR